MKTLYEILEVSETASEEIIEKAYKVLAKKHHPDLQPQEKKQQAEQIMKQINEAYSILGDKQKRQAYNEKLNYERQAIRQKQENTTTNYQKTSSTTKQTANSYQNENKAYHKEQEIRQWQEVIKAREEAQIRKQKEVQEQYEKKYQEAYEGYLRSLGYKIKYKWTWKNYRNLLIAILVVISICAILWCFPPTHNYIIEFYESNPIIKTIIDVIGKIIIGIWNAICSIFK